MSKQNLAIEPHQVRRDGRDVSDRQFEKTGLDEIAAHNTLVLATAMANAVLGGLEMRERQKLRRLVLMIVSGVVVLIGLGQLAIVQLLRG